MKKFFLLASFFASNVVNFAYCRSIDCVDPWEPTQFISRVSCGYQHSFEERNDFWIQTHQPLYATPNTFRNTVFMQFRASIRSEAPVGSYESFNVGGVYRLLSDCENWLFGLNGFYCMSGYNRNENVSIGIDMRNKWMTLTANCYSHINGWRMLTLVDGVTTSTRALNGTNFEFTFPMPHIPSLRLGGGLFYWNTLTKENTTGYHVSAIINIIGPLSIEGGRWSEINNSTHNNYVSAELRFGFPNHIQYTLFKDCFTKNAYPPRNLRRFILDPVIKIEHLNFEKKLTGSDGILIGRGT